MAGKVYLVGAGPGDPQLITVKGMHILSQADVVLYDGLVHEDLLQFAPPSSIRVCVGKRGHGGAWQQSKINDLIVEYANRFPRVVRLKGGDTSVFARSSEEMDRLIAEGIDYEVVPGLTAALAVSAYTGIPITHRDWSSCVALVTGQGQVCDGDSDFEDSTDWESLARFPGTLVLYMALSNAAVWSRRLIEAGKPETTPVALIRRCTWTDQTVLTCELAQVADTLSRHPEFQPPVIGIVGEVVRAASQKSWFMSQPLFGNSFLITNPPDQAMVLGQMLREKGGEIVYAPAIEIAEPESWASVDQAIALLGETDWLVFSSGHGVRSFFDRIQRNGLDARAFASLQLAAVGPSTAASLASNGLRCDLVPEHEFGAASLWTLLEPLAAGKRFTLVRALEGNTLLQDRLAPVASRVILCDAYRQLPVASWPTNLQRSLLAKADLRVVVTSSNAARQAVRLLDGPGPNVKWLSISSAVTKVLEDLGYSQIATADVANYEGLVAKALQVAERNEKNGAVD